MKLYPWRFIARGLGKGCNVVLQVGPARLFCSFSAGSRPTPWHWKKIFFFSYLYSKVLSPCKKGRPKGTELRWLCLWTGQSPFSRERLPVTPDSPSSEQTPQNPEQIAGSRWVAFALSHPLLSGHRQCFFTQQVSPVASCLRPALDFTDVADQVLIRVFKVRHACCPASCLGPAPWHHLCPTFPRSWTCSLCVWFVSVCPPGNVNLTGWARKPLVRFVLPW